MVPESEKLVNLQRLEGISLDGNVPVFLSRGTILDEGFYDRPTPFVAHDLLGKVMVHYTDNGASAVRIVETEAYLGKRDSACHAAYGQTPRSKIFYESGPGTLYVFQCHAYSCLNVLTGGDDPTGCVLIRAGEPVYGLDAMRERRSVCDSRELTNGPGKLGLAMGVSRVLNGTRVTDGPIRIIDDGYSDYIAAASPRVGISKEVQYLLRYFITQNPYVS